MSCKAPVAWETLVDWWAGDLDDARASAVEEHLLGCEACSAVAGRVAATAETLRTMVPPVVRPERLQGLARAGVRILENPIEPGQTNDFHFPKDVDLAVHVLGGLAFEAGARVDVTLRSIATGAVLGHFEDAPFDASRGAVYLACQRDYAQLDHDLIAEVRVAKDRPPAHYTILHHF
jgi:putative zinc finger protein